MAEEKKHNKGATLLQMWPREGAMPLTKTRGPAVTKKIGTQQHGVAARRLPVLANQATPSAVMPKEVPGGVVHELPPDLRRALSSVSEVLRRWASFTPLARNEYICWIEDAKQAATRARRIHRAREDIENGKRRPCCWPGCKHRERLCAAVRSAGAWTAPV